MHPLLTCSKLNPLHPKVTYVRLYMDNLSIALDPSCVVRGFESDIDIKILFSKVDSPSTQATVGVFWLATRQKWLVSRRINFRKQYFYIDVGVKVVRPFVELSPPQPASLGGMRCLPPSGARIGQAGGERGREGEGESERERGGTSFRRTFASPARKSEDAASSSSREREGGCVCVCVCVCVCICA